MPSDLYQPVSRRALFLGFFQIGLSGFGGVLPWAHRILVEQRRWLSDEEFTELLSLGQTIPGPNICNMSVVIGARFYGLSGAILALAGLLLAPLCIVLMLGTLYRQFGHLGPIPQMLNGIAAVAAGLVLGTGIKLAIKLRRKLWIVLIALGAFASVALFHFSLISTLLTLAPLSIALAWWQRVKDSALLAKAQA